MNGHLASATKAVALALVISLELGLTPTAGAQAALDVAYVPKQVNNSYFDVAATGGMHAAMELGGQFKQVGPSAAVAAAQVPFIEDLTSQRVGAIVVSADDPDVIAPALHAARQAGIKVVGYDSSPAVGAYDVFVNQANTQDIGRVLVQMACDEAPGCSGDFAVLSSTSTATNQNAWIDAMKQTLTDPRYAGLNLVDVAYGNDDALTSQAEALALLEAHPDLRVIVSPDDDWHRVGGERAGGDRCIGHGSVDWTGYAELHASVRRGRYCQGVRAVERPEARVPRLLRGGQADFR